MILIVVTVLIVASTKWSDNKPVSKIVIEGNHFVKHKDIYNSVSKYVLNLPRKDIKLDTISFLVKQNKYIMDVNSSYGINGDLKIEVQEREPISYLIDAMGYLHIVDRSGYIFNNYNVPKNFELPVIYLNKDKFNNLALKTTLNFIFELQSNKSDFNNYISEFNIGEDHRLVLAKDKLYRKLLVFSNNNAIAQFNKFKTFVANNNLINRISNVAYFDLRWNNRIVLGKT